MLVFGLCISAFSSAAVAVTQDVIQVGLRAVSYSIAVITQNFLGASFAPFVIGYLIDRIGIREALLILPFVLLIGSVMFFLGSQHYESDFTKVKKVALEAES